MRPFRDYPFEARLYNARLPELVRGADARRHEVVVVGGGVVGLATALALARFGVASVVLEADDRVCTGSRAICISRRSLEIIAGFGALDAFLSKGLPWMGGRSYYRDTEVLRFEMQHDENQMLPPMVNIEQYYIEQFLLDAVERCDLIDVRWQSRATAIDVQPDGVRLAVETPLGSYSMDCDWLVGCDGARSFVRDAVGLKPHGTSYEGRYVIVDIALKSDRPTERLAWFDPPSNPGSTILMHAQPDDVWRIDYQLKDDEDPAEAVRPENVIPRVESHLRMIGERDDWAPIWISLYKANALTLGTYRSGRVLLAGDAAHLVPIFGVRGANSGFEDANNLAWKLALVIGGVAGDALLDSYSSERVQAARENLREGMKSTEFMSPPSYGFELMRTAVLGLAVEHPFVRPLINPRQTQPSGYRDSPLHAGVASGDDFTGGPARGAVFLECPVMIPAGDTARAGHLSELLEPAFTALWFSARGEVPAGLTRLESDLAHERVPFRIVAVAREQASDPGHIAALDHTGRLFALYDAAPGTLYLLRPDGHVLARWKSATAETARAAIQAALRRPVRLQEMRT